MPKIMPARGQKLPKTTPPGPTGDREIRRQIRNLTYEQRLFRVNVSHAAMHQIAANLRRSANVSVGYAFCTNYIRDRIAELQPGAPNCYSEATTLPASGSSR